MNAETIERLLVTIEGSSDLLRQELRKSGADVSSWSRSTEERVGKTDLSFKRLASTLRTTLGIFGVAFGAGAIISFTRSAIQAADAIGETARAAGIGAERFQRLSFVFQNNGVNAAEFDSAMKALNTRLGQFIVTGGGPAKAALDRLGLSQKVMNGEIRTSEQLFDAVVANFDKLGTAAEQGAVAAALFGKNAGPLMRDTLSQGTQALRAAEAAARGLYSDEQVRQADLLNDAMKRLSSTIGVTLKGAIIETAADLADMFGLIDQGVRGQLADLDELIRNLEAAEKAGSLGGNRRLLEDARARRAALSQAAQHEQLLDDVAAGRLPFIQSPGVKPDEGLHEITSGEDWRKKIGMLSFDFAGARDQALNSQLQEMGVVINKMPEDLKKLPPEFNAAVDALNRYNEGLTEAQKGQRELVNTIEHGLQSAIGNALKTGRLEFKDFLRDLAIDLASSAFAKGLMSIFTRGAGGGLGFFGKLFGGFRAEGGPLSPGKWYIAGEKGPEPVWGGGTGAFAMAAGPGGGSLAIYNTANITGGGGDNPDETAALMNRAMADWSRKTIAQFRELMRRRQL